MLDIIIYGGSVRKRSVEKRLIENVLSNYNIDYNLYNFSDLDNIINDNYMKKIYIINVMNSEYVKMLSLIRRKDPYCIIISVANSKKYHYDLNNKLMVLDFIFGNNYADRLSKDLDYAINLIYRYYVFTFKYNHVVYAIPYDKINYIEKESSIKRCIIHTLDGNYYIVSSLSRILLSLSNGFLRTHQSCIVNINNIKKIDLALNKIIFNNNDTTSLLANSVKKDINKYVDIG